MGVAWWHEAVRALQVNQTRRHSEREAEFERLVLPLESRMMRTVWRVTRDPELAEDALQEALLTAWRKLPDVGRHPNPQALVLRFCLDAAMDQLRRHHRRRRSWTSLEGDGTADEGPSPERAAAATEEAGLVLAALAKLGERQATAMLLRAVHELPYSAVAEALGCGEATARVHVQRAREKLRRRLAPLLARDEETRR